MANRVTIFSFIVVLLGTSGLRFWAFLVFLGLCRHSFGADWLLARKLRSSSKWSYLVHHSSLLNVVPLEGEKL